VSRRALLLGLLAFLLALVIVLPARWVGAMLPSVVQCRGWSGSLWRGSCGQLTVNAPGVKPVTLETVGWTLHPLPLMRLRLAADVVMTDARGDATGRVELTRKGLLVLRNVSARALFGRDLPIAMPAGWSGRVEVSQLEVDWQANRLEHLQGDLRFLDLRDEQGRELGNYQVKFPPAIAPPFKGELSDAGGPFELHGVLELTRDRHWSVQGTVRSRPGADAAFSRNLEILGAADSAGRYPVSIEGSFN
jgi:hypothetical protein